MKRILLTLFFISFPAICAQTKIPDYGSARDNWFWDKLYTFGGTGFYCSIKFDEQGKYIDYKGKEKKMTLEHVYSADWIADHHHCDNRNTCDIEAYKFAEADLHNLWPTDGSVNSSRSNYPFREIPDEVSENRYSKKGCSDFERLYDVKQDKVLIEPRDAIKGKIARSMLYMHEEYGLPLRGMQDLMLSWHKQYPVDFEELWRNQKIYELQGTYNMWIGEVKQ